MTLEHIFESRPGYGITASIEEEFGDGGLATDSEPSTKIGTGPLPNRQDSFASAFSEDSNERPRLKGHVIGSQTDQFGDSETCNKAYIQHGSIANSKPSLWVGDIQYGLHFFEREMCHHLSVGLLKRYRLNLPDLFQRGWYLILDIPHEGFDGGQSGVPRHRSIFALGLDVLQERENQGGIDLLQVKLRWTLAQPRSGILEQQAEGMRVGIAGMFTRTTIHGKPLAQECGDMRGQRCHDWPPLPKLSADRSEICASTWGVA
jgi:hypothetical protein